MNSLSADSVLKLAAGFCGARHCIWPGARPWNSNFGPPRLYNFLTNVRQDSDTCRGPAKYSPFSPGAQESFRDRRFPSLHRRDRPGTLYSSRRGLWARPGISSRHFHKNEKICKYRGGPALWRRLQPVDFRPCNCKIPQAETCATNPAGYVATFSGISLGASCTRGNVTRNVVP